MSSTFALLGAAGYVAQRHLHAIKEVGGRLTCAMDVSDSVGVLDSYFPLAEFHTEEAAFWSAVQEAPPTYVVICTPNHLHISHILLALRAEANVICEKPLVVDPQDLARIEAASASAGRQVFPILQLRLHPEIQRLKQGPFEEIQQVSLRYITRRGSWYLKSWKGDDSKSGGLLMNIGVHFFDALIDIYGPVESFFIENQEPTRVAGELGMERATVVWELSIAAEDLPSPDVSAARIMLVGDEEVDFTSGFTDLHTEAYRLVLRGEGFCIADCRPALQLIDDMRRSPILKTT